MGIFMWDGTSIVNTDKTLTIEDMAADAKATGDIKNLFTRVSEVTVPLDVLSGKTLNSDGTIADYSQNQAWKVTGLTDISGYESIKVSAGSGYWSLVYAFYDANQTFISGLNARDDILNISQQSVEIPSNAKYIRLSKNGTSGLSLVGSATTYGSIDSYDNKWHDKKWTVVGDSMTALSDKATKQYFHYIAEATGITVVNMGVSGSGYKAMYDTNQAFYQRILNVPSDSDVVTIFGSFNDGISDLGSASDTGTNTVAGCINTTIDNLYSVIPTVSLGIISSPPLIGANPYNHPEANANPDLLAEICKKRSIPFLNLYYESNLRPWDSSFLPLAYSKDGGGGVHPDETGHKILASRFYAFLNSLII